MNIFRLITKLVFIKLEFGGGGSAPAAPPPPPPPPPPPSRADAAKVVGAMPKDTRNRGRAATILTSGLGASDDQRKTTLGG